jgi:signal transduction histidine kinase
MKSLYLSIVILLVGGSFIFSWMFLITPELKNEQGEFFYMTSYFGKFSQVQRVGDELSQPTPIFATYKEEVSKANGNTLEIFSSFIAYNVLTDEILWQVNRTNLVDKNTRLFLEPADVYFRFPQNTEKQNYQAYLHANEPRPFVFEDEVYLRGLKIYRFSCSFTTDASSSYPQLSPSQVLTDNTCKVLIEPITGNEIYYEENWFDYIVENGEKIPISTGNVHTTDFTVDILAKNTIDKIRLFYIYETVLPVLFSLVVGVSYFAFIIYHKQSQIIIEERSRREKHEKLSMLGDLAARVAHDIRNPLAIINNAASMMKSTPNLGEEDKKRLSQIENAVFRISHQVDSVLDYIRQRQLNIEEHNVSKLVDSVISELRNPNNIPIVRQNLDMNIKCDYQLMKIVLINILVNAIQAVGNYGKITIRASDLKDKKILEVEDTGPGISEKNLPKIFEPLFTTKQQGTGLGLSSCLNIINQHEGTITAKNNPTTFIITLPTNPNIEGS